MNARKEQFDLYAASIFFSQSELRALFWILTALSIETRQIKEKCILNPSLGLSRLEFWKDAIQSLSAKRVSQRLDTDHRPCHFWMARYCYCCLIGACSSASSPLCSSRILWMARTKASEGTEFTLDQKDDSIDCKTHLLHHMKLCCSCKLAFSVCL